MNYTAVIRTLGTAGEKYQILLDSLNQQTLQPSKILVYIAEGYAIPKETIGKEQYIYVKKGMVAQRALRYDEVDTEFILFLDDDLFLPTDFVEKMYFFLEKNHADVISPDVFPNAERDFLGKCIMLLSGRMMPRKDDGKWGYKVMRNAGYSYNNHPKPGVYWSQTNAAACFLCKKMDFLKIHFEEELWMDDLKYAQGDDQVMYYKMYLSGLKQLTWFGSGIKHLDAGSGLISEQKEKMLIYSDFYFKTVFWHRFIFKPEKSFLKQFYSVIYISYTFCFSLIISLLKGRWDIFRTKYKSIISSISFIESNAYKKLSPVIDQRLCIR